ncbi:MAG: hypothetical protein ACRDRO_11795 [Pseudonocardiaceae bacterium]
MASGAPGLSGYQDPRNHRIWRGGEIVIDYTKTAQRKRDKKGNLTDEPDFWDDGQPKEQLVATVQSADRDPERPEDDGVRRMFFPIGYAKKPGSKYHELIEALNRTGSPGPRVGGQLYEMVTGTEKGQGTIDRYVWAVHYVPPAVDPGRQLDSAMSAPAAPPAPPAPPSAPPAPPAQNGNPAYQNGAPPPPPNAPQPQYAQAPAGQLPPPPSVPAQNGQQQYASPPPPGAPHNPYA